MRMQTGFARRRATLMTASGPRGPLYGLPMTIKSSIAVAGLHCEVGSLLRRGTVAEKDAVVVSRVRQAGANILGTTNCPEYLMAYETDNRLHGQTRNPWNLEYSSGGSSGGESAAIAAGMSAGGLGQRQRRISAHTGTRYRHLQSEADTGSNSRNRS